jgi:ribosomal-protein-alanine N-acetyltransferase
MEQPPRPSAAAAVRLLRTGAERASEIAALHRLLFEPGWDEAAVARLLDRPASLAFVAEASGRAELAGFVLAQVAADEAEILSVGVSRSCQRAGLGSRLVAELVCRLRSLCVRELFLEVATDNAAALACYRKLGFTAVGVRTSYYARRANVRADAVVLKLAL